MKKNRVLSCLMWHGNDDVVSKSLADVLLLVLRWFIAWQFLKAGLVKLDDWSSTLALFESEYQVPLLSPVLAAYLGTAGELVFPILLMAGLFTRWAALGLFAVNAMAVISYPQLFTFDCPAAINDHKYWAVILAVIFVFGAGRLSVDALFGRKTA
jgi:putative oxidoreductase